MLLFPTVCSSRPRLHCGCANLYDVSCHTIYVTTCSTTTTKFFFFFKSKDNSIRGIKNNWKFLANLPGTSWENSYFAPGHYDDHTKAMMIDCFLFRSTKQTQWLLDQTMFSRVCERGFFSFQKFLFGLENESEPPYCRCFKKSICQWKQTSIFFEGKILYEKQQFVLVFFFQKISRDVELIYILIEKVISNLDRLRPFSLLVRKLVFRVVMRGRT